MGIRAWGTVWTSSLFKNIYKKKGSVCQCGRAAGLIPYKRTTCNVPPTDITKRSPKIQIKLTQFTFLPSSSQCSIFKVKPNLSSHKYYSASHTRTSLAQNAIAPLHPSPPIPPLTTEAAVRREITEPRMTRLNLIIGGMVEVATTHLVRYRLIVSSHNAALSPEGYRSESFSLTPNSDSTAPIIPDFHGGSRYETIVETV